MWLEWLEDEEKLLEADDDPEALLSLYDRAIGDYRYFKVCRRFCKLVLRLYEQDRVTA